MRAREFERELSSLSFWSESEIAQCTRYLRGAGLLPIGGRGLNAPDIEPKHAALILIGLAAARRAADVDKAVEIYGSMPPVGEAFAGAATFAEALASILASWRSFRKTVRITAVVICSSWPEAAVRFSMQGEAVERSILYGDPGTEHPGPRMRSDVTFSPATLSMLALKFKSPEEDKAEATNG